MYTALIQRSTYSRTMAIAIGYGVDPARVQGGYFIGSSKEAPYPLVRDARSPGRNQPCSEHHRVNNW